jgi:hypothetical protein
LWSLHPVLISDEKKMRHLLFLVVLLAGVWILWRVPRMTWRRTTSGASVYVNAVRGSKETAQYLEHLRQKAASFLRRAIDLDPGDPRLTRISRRWTGDLSEVETGSKNIAYSISKSDVHVCVRDARGTLGGENAAMYVILHEFAHIATEEYGHTEKFWANMRYLLEIAERLDMYSLHEKGDTLCDRPLGESPLSCLRAGKCDSELAKKKL